MKPRENEEGRSGEAAPRSGGESPAGLSASGTSALELRVEAPMRMAMSLSLLQEHLAAARRRISESTTSPLDPCDRLDALAMDFLVIVQNTLDLSFAIVQWHMLGRPQSHVECFRLLAQNAILDETLVEPLGLLVRTRGDVARGHLTRQGDAFVSGMPIALDIFDRFAASVASWFGADT